VKLNFAKGNNLENFMKCPPERIQVKLRFTKEMAFEPGFECCLNISLTGRERGTAVPRRKQNEFC
jgi:hypothetical protein